MTGTRHIFSLSGNALKVLAAISMVIDHVGMLIFPDEEIFRIIGRLAFPIFSYMICEGCRHTRHRLRYLLQVLILGIATTAVYAIAMDELYFNALITFSCSITLILLLTTAKENEKTAGRLLYLSLFAVSAAIFYLFTLKFTVDYGFWGIMLPVFPFISGILFPEERNEILALTPQLPAFGIGLAVLSFDIGWVQPYSLLALIPLAFYNGRQGFKLPKYSFYVFYPLHIGIIYLISLMI